MKRKVAAEDGLSHHYRYTKVASSVSEGRRPVKDGTAMKWSHQLIERVKRVCGDVFNEGSCPLPTIKKG